MNYIINDIAKDSALITIKDFDKEQKISFINTPSNRKYLEKALTSDDYNKIISVWGDRITAPDYVPVVLTEPELTRTRQEIIKQMRDKCNEVITKGFDIELSDGEKHHFSLEIIDQINIKNLLLKSQSGETELSYHADDEICRFFTAEEILLINNKMEETIEYHTTYFNSLKNYINSLSVQDDLQRITYGVEIPEEYKSEVLKKLTESKKV